MVKLRKTLKALTAAAMTFSLACTSVPFTASVASASSTITFLQGDVNGDGSVSTVDVALISKYLNGTNGATAQQITRMDAFANKVIEMQDYNKILDFAIRIETPQTVTFEAYSAIDDSTRVYYAYNCTTGLQYDEYSLSSNTVGTNVNSRIFETYNDYADDNNLNTIQLSYGDGCIGSAFIVDDHVIATAAHCVYNKDTSELMENLKINIYNSNGTNVTATYHADYAHVPAAYVDGTWAFDNYDYALLYFSEDLSSYGIWSLGCMTTEFMATGSDVIVSGYTAHDNVFRRYYSCGEIINFNENAPDQYNDKSLRFTASAKSYDGKSGGPVYYESTYNDTTIKSVIGICTGAAPEDNDTWGTRITPTLLKFYLNNPNL